MYRFVKERVHRIVDEHAEAELFVAGDGGRSLGRGLRCTKERPRPHCHTERDNGKY